MDATDHKGLTPLMMACMFGRSLMAAYLLGRGARPHLTDMNGDSALHWAAYKGFPSLMQMLIYSGFDPQKPGEEFKMYEMIGEINLPLQTTLVLRHSTLPASLATSWP